MTNALNHFKEISSMRRFVTGLALVSALAYCVAGMAADNPPVYIGKHTSTSQDSTAINKVIEDFGAAIRNKDAKLLSTLVLHSNILFDAPTAPEGIAMMRDKVDANFDGLRSGGYSDFARFIGTTKDQVEEKFYNVKITQDKNVAWVMFDYEFVVNGKTQNYGIETWQMMKAVDEKWKIASVMWTINRPN
jgi:ketosteroid isomerase-like protein